MEKKLKMSILQYFSLKSEAFSFFNLYTLFKMYEIFILIRSQKNINIYQLFNLLNDFADIYLYTIINNYIFIRIIIYLVVNSRTIYYSILIIFSLIKNKKIVPDELNQYIDNMPIGEDSKYVLKTGFNTFEKINSFINKNLIFQ